MKLLRSLFTRVDAFVDKYLIQTLIFSFVTVGTLIVLWPIVVKVVPSGYAGVLYRPLFGGVYLDRVYGEGIHFVLPWDTFYQYNARVQTNKVDLEVLTSDLLKTRISVVYQYEVNAATLPLLHKYVGPNYAKTVIEPLVISSARDRIASFSSQKAFTSEFSRLVTDIAITSDKILVDNISPPGFDNIKMIRITSAEIIDITFPPDVEQAIAAKLVDAEKAYAYEYKILAETQEAKRKAIEAEGIAKFQDIVRPGLSENYLRWRGIEATQKLAESNNSKIVMFGSGSTGLPLILGDMDKSQNKSK
jgi:prohibitin 1